MVYWYLRADVFLLQRLHGFSDSSYPLPYCAQNSHLLFSFAAIGLKQLLYKQMEFTAYRGESHITYLCNQCLSGFIFHKGKERNESWAITSSFPVLIRYE